MDIETPSVVYELPPPNNRDKRTAKRRRREAGLESNQRASENYNPRLGSDANLGLPAPPTNQLPPIVPPPPRSRLWGVSPDMLDSASVFTTQKLIEAFKSVDNTGSFITSTAQDIVGKWRTVGFVVPFSIENLRDLMLSFNKVDRGLTAFNLISDEARSSFASLTRAVMRKDMDNLPSLFITTMNLYGKAMASAVEIAADADKANTILTTQQLALTNDIYQKANQARTLQEEITFEKSKATEAQNTARRLQGELTALNTEHQRMYRGLVGAGNTIDSLKATNKDIRKTLQETEEERERLKTSLDQQTERYNTLEMDKNSLNGQVLSLMGDISSQEAEFERIKALLKIDKQWNGTMGDLVIYYNNHYQALQKTAEELQTSLDELKALMGQNEDTLKTTQQDLQTQIDANNEKLATIQRQGNEIARLKQEKETLEDKIQTYDELITAAEADKSELLRKITRATQAKGQAERISREQIAEASSLRTAAEQYKTQRDEYQRQFDAASRVIASYATQVGDLENANRALQLRIDENANMMATMQETIDSVNIDKANLESQLNEARTTGQENAANLVLARTALEEANVAIANAEAQTTALREETAREAERLRAENAATLAELRTQVRRIMEANQAVPQSIALVDNGAMEVEEDHGSEVINAHVPGAPLPFEVQNQLAVIGGGNPRGLPGLQPARRPAAAGGIVIPGPGGRPRRATVAVRVNVARAPAEPQSNKRARNATAGGYVVGGRPDPIISPSGPAFWRNVYKSRYHLF